jgi:probable phosphoglycerate mutase
MTEIGLIRHGVTDWNVLKKIQGKSDIPLNGEGRRQAKQLAERLRREQWDAVVTSDLVRAKETAEIVAQALGIPVASEDARLRERSFGAAEGTTEEERLARWGEKWRENPDIGIESVDALLARALPCLDDLAEAYAGRRILAVTHGGWIVHVLTALFPDLEFGWIGNTSVSVIRRTADGWKPVDINRMDHLEGETE